MTNYKEAAKDFLAINEIGVRTIYLDREVNLDWDETCKRDTYMAIIHTPKGNMQVKFWDSLANTTKNLERTRCGYPRINPSAYDILSCLTTYDVGSIEDFIFDFGFEIKEKGDLGRVQRMYDAVCKEYSDVCRCFTPKQIEILQELCW